jgi:predicted Zn-dependent protease
VTRSVVLAVIVLWTAAAAASNTVLTGTDGHPRSRLPLQLHLASLGDAKLDEAAARAVDDWNALARDILGVTVFTRVARTDEAQVRVSVEPAGASRRMGVTELESDDGVIRVPVRIAITAPAARGQVSRDVVLYQVLAHELGHALGLVHVSDPRSLMCCIEGEVDLNDAATREAYLTARRHPDVRSAATQLAEHYRRFWSSR